MSIRNHKKYDVNPSDIKVINRIVVRERAVKRLGTGEKGELSVISTQGEVIDTMYNSYNVQMVYDPAKFIKGFLPLFDILPKMSKSGIAVFCYIVKFELKQNQGFIYMDKKACMKELSYAEKSVELGIVNCLDTGILYRTEMFNKFWINKEVFFNGKKVNNA